MKINNILLCCANIIRWIPSHETSKPVDYMIGVVKHHILDMSRWQCWADVVQRCSFSFNRMAKVVVRKDSDVITLPPRIIRYVDPCLVRQNLSNEVFLGRSAIAR